MEEVLNWVRQVKGLDSDAMIDVEDIVGILAPSQCGIGCPLDFECEGAIIQKWKTDRRVAGCNESLLAECRNPEHSKIQPCFCIFQIYREEYLKKCHKYYTCDNCGTTNFLGTRYHCCECPNYDICQHCFEGKGHQCHQMEEFTEPVMPPSPSKRLEYF